MTAPAFICTSEPWAALSFGRPIFDPNECRSFAPVLFRLSLHRRCIQVLHFEPIARAAGLVGGILALRHNVFEAELAMPCGIFVTVGKCFRPITLLGDFPVRMSQSGHAGACAWGVETILLIVILTFVAGFVLDRLAMRRRRFDAEKSKTKL